MINICIKDIVEATKGKLLCGDEKQQIDHLSIDSRSSQGNDLFIPIIGAKVDAHRFIDGAFGGGDIRLLAVMGFYLGWKMCLVGTVTGFFFGGLQAVILLISGR